MASTAALELIVSLKDDASKALDNIAQKGGFLKDALSFATGGLITAGIGAIGGSLSGFFGDAIAESRDWNAAMAQTDAVLKSTGGSAGVTRSMVEDLANSLSSNSGLSKAQDDAVASAENLLLTFTGIGKDVFPQATQTMLDMTSAMNRGDVSSQNMKATAIQLGKALNDPATGMSALQRVGVTFSEAQKEQIKVMEKAGDTAGAQKVILAELAKEFGGSAKAAAAAGGPMVLFTAAMNNIKQSVGDAVLPILGKLGEFINSPGFIGALQWVADIISGALTQGFTFFGQALTIVIPILQSVGGALIEPFQKALPVVSSVINFLRDNAQVVLVMLAGVLTGIIIPAFIGWAATMLTVTLPALVATMASIIAAAAPFILLGALITGLYFAFQNNFLGIRDIVMSVVTAIVESISRFWTEAQPQLAAAWAAISSTVTNAWTTISGVVVGGVTALVAAWQSNWGGLQTIVTGVWTVISGIVTTGWEVVTGLISAGLSVLSGNWSGAWATIQSTFTAATGSMSGVLQNLGSVIMAFATAFVPALVGKLGEWGGAFLGFIAKDVLPFIVEKLGALGTAIWNWITGGGLAGLISNLATWGGAFLGFIAKDVLPFIVEKLGTLGTAIWNWITGGGLAGLISNLATWGGAFLGFIAKDVLPFIVEKLAALGTAVWNWITGTALPAIVAKLSEWGTAFLGWIAKVVADMPGKLADIWSAISAWATKTSNDIFSAVKLWVTSFWGWVTQVLSDMPGKLGGVWDSISSWAVKTAKDIGAAVLGIGKGIVDGIGAGISGAWDAFVKWVEGLLSGMVDAIKAFFGISSPSLVMRDQIGKWIPAGLAEGITAGWPTVTTSLTTNTASAITSNKADWKRYGGEAAVNFVDALASGINTGYQTTLTAMNSLTGVTGSAAATMIAQAAAAAAAWAGVGQAQGQYAGTNAGYSGGNDYSAVQYPDASVDMGSHAGGGNRANVQAASGFSGLITRPTQFTVAERYAEYVDVYKSGDGPRGSGGGFIVNINKIEVVPVAGMDPYQYGAEFAKSLYYQLGDIVALRQGRR